MPKRSDYLPWDDYFMSVALLSALRSKDPNTQVGACIVNAENKIVGIGYNGFPIGCGDDDLPWDRAAEDWLDTKYPYVCHAELNAITNANKFELRGSRLYCTHMPCNECAKIIIQSGLRAVSFLEDKYPDSRETRAAQRLFALAKVDLKAHAPQYAGVLSLNLRPGGEA